MGIGNTLGEAENVEDTRSDNSSSEIETNYSAPAAGCASEILLLLARSPEPLSLAEITQSVGRTKSLSFRVLKELQAADLVHKPDGSRYELGLSALELGAAVADRLGESSVTREAIRSLSAETGQTVNVGALKGFDVMFVMKQEAPRSAVTISHVGQRLPANCSALGKALLMQLDDGEVDQLMPEELVALTSKTVTDRNALLEEVRISRERGFAVDRESAILGRGAVAVPIKLPHMPEVIAGMAVTASLDDFDLERTYLLDCVTRARSAIERVGTAHRTLGTAFGRGG
ncbi:MAG: IclR family transcriptional regulator [Acidimicrobiia bacterium]